MREHDIELYSKSPRESVFPTDVARIDVLCTEVNQSVTSVPQCSHCESGLPGGESNPGERCEGSRNVRLNP